jgi:hypothetical protein
MRRFRFPLLLLAVTLCSTPAWAEVYTVTLNGGGTFLSRYRPQESPWDANKVLLRTEFGNWISLFRSDIESVAADTETKGFGLVIDEATVELGTTANDAPVPEEGKPGEVPPPAFMPPPAPYTIPQFVEPGQAQGIPTSYLNYGQDSTQPSAAPVVVPPGQ